MSLFINAGPQIPSGEKLSLDLNVGDPLPNAVEENGLSLQGSTYPNPQIDPLQADGSTRNPDNGWGSDFVRPGDVVILPASTQSGDGSSTEASAAGNLLRNAQNVVADATNVTSQLEQPTSGASEPEESTPLGHFHT
jgi:hypothetical protein